MRPFVSSRSVSIVFLGVVGDRLTLTDIDRRTGGDRTMRLSLLFALYRVSQWSDACRCREKNRLLRTMQRRDLVARKLPNTPLPCP